MEHTPHLSDTLVHVLRPHAKWVEQRPRKTLAWMMGGLRQSGWISLTAWPPSGVRRARDAQRTVRRLRRWLDHDTMAVWSLYGPLRPQALAEWGEQALYGAWDTSMLWHPSCLIRLSVLDRGRAGPLVWCGLEHGSAQGGCETSRGRLERAAVLLPRRCQGIVLADRGCAETDLMAHLGHRGWPWRIRIKRRCWRARRGWRRWKVERLAVARGQACFWHQVSIPAKPYGPVYLAVAHAWQGQDAWDVLRDAPTERKTFQEYGLRCEIAENCVDDKSNGCPVESSLMRSAPALTRLCLGLAMTTLYLVSQGVEVVQPGTRRWVAPHWLRGQSYVQSGWNWVQWALSRGMDLITTMHWSSDGDPEPAMASKRQ